MVAEQHGLLTISTVGKFIHSVSRWHVLMLLLAVSITFGCALIYSESFRLRAMHPGYWAFIHFGGKWDQKYEILLGQDIHRDDLISGLSVEQIMRKLPSCKDSSLMRPHSYRQEESYWLLRGDRAAKAVLWLGGDDNDFGWAILVGATPDENRLDIIKG